MIVESFARLSFGLIDLSDKAYRIDGCHGLYTNLPIGKVSLNIGERDFIEILDINPKRYYGVIEKCRKLLRNKKINLKITVTNYLGTHIGLGSGTQLAMSIVEAFDRTFNLNLSIDEKAYLAGSGGSSNIGVYCFERGGYNLDAGRLYPEEKNSIGPGENFSFKTLSPLLMNLNMPNWYVCIAIPKSKLVIGDALETDLFHKYTPIPVEEVNEICKWILKGILPAIMTDNFDAFCHSLECIMKIGFRAREIKTYGNLIVNHMSSMKKAGLNGVGMTSFGPSMFGFANNIKQAEHAKRVLNDLNIFDAVYLTTVRNRGAEIIETP